MTTTAIVVEIVVIGYTAFIWLVLFSLAKFGIPTNKSLTDIYQYKELIPLVIFFATAIAYQIGWLIDYFSYFIFYYIGIGRKIKRTYIPDNEFWDVYNVVCQNGSEAIQATLKNDIRIIRFARSGFINFLLIGIGSFWLSKLKLWIVLLLCVIISIGCLIVLINRWTHYYHKIKISYDFLKGKAANRKRMLYWNRGLTKLNY